MKKLSVAMIACNEEEKIGRALKSLKEIADEIVVVDSGSNDRTPEICGENKARVVREPWKGYRDQKQLATDLTRYQWVLSLDADEEISPLLKEEIIEWKKSGPSENDGYLIPRMTRFMDRWITHTTWYPDRQLRLFRKDRGRWEGLNIHEGFHCRGKTAVMSGHIYHYTYSDISEYLTQLERFSGLAAKDHLARGKKTGMPRLLLSPPLVFLKNYFLKAGFKDGRAGFVVSCLSAISTFFKLLRAEELRRGEPKI